MKIAIIVLIAMALFPYMMAWVSGFYRVKELGKIDNKNPRQQYTQLTGVGARAVAAQQNCWEALAFYSAALLAVSASGVSVDYLAETALVVLVCRTLYCICYLANLDKFRSLLFGLGTIPYGYWFYVVIANS